MTGKENPESRPQLQLLNRPQGHLHDFPIDVRWEVTRRHPYYLVFWEDAQKYWKEPPGDWSKVETWLGYAAVLMLGNIGVSGEPVPPETAASQLDENTINPAFLTGSVQPISVRHLVVTLISKLPPALLVQIGQIMSNAGSDVFSVPDDDEYRTLQKNLALGDLLRLPEPFLNNVFDVSIFFVHLGASLHSILRDMERQAKHWKETQGYGSSKVQSAKLDEYLKVWDLREGWTGRGYDRTKELTFGEIARRLKAGSISTVANRYRSAFKMITGYDFKPELWWQLFAAIRYMEVIGNPKTSFASRVIRQLRSPVRRPVPESAIGPRPDDGHGIGMVESLAVTHSGVEMAELLMDLDDLINRGLSDEEIAQKLELKDPSMVPDLRLRLTEFQTARIGD